VSGYHALDSEYIHLDQNLARGLSGTGYGDSGGPTFLTVDDNAHAFLDPYLALTG
jgi:hypothetical protein